MVRATVPDTTILKTPTMHITALQLQPLVPVSFKDQVIAVSDPSDFGLPVPRR